MLNKKGLREKGQELHTIDERILLEKIKYPFLVQLHYAFQDPDYLYMILDFAQGGELFYHLHRETFFNNERMQFYAAELVLALDYLHKKGYIYRDLKPENILIDEDGYLVGPDGKKYDLKDADVLLPVPRNYFIETNYSQYAHAHHAVDLDTTRAILQEKYPDYVDTYDAYMKKTTGHRFNMFIMKKELFDAYCTWLFDILFELENRLDVSGYSDYDARVFGFVSERLLDVWIGTNGIKYKNIPYAFMEKQNWFTKIGRFLMRKIKKSDEEQ